MDIKFKTLLQGITISQAKDRSRLLRLAITRIILEKLKLGGSKMEKMELCSGSLPLFFFFFRKELMIRTPTYISREWQ